MADEHVDIEIHNTHQVDLMLNHLDEQSRRQLKDYLDDIGLFAQKAARLEAPVGETRQLVRRIQRTGVKQRGAYYEQVVGVTQGEPYPLYVHGGTGLYRKNDPKRIFPHPPRRYMRFTWKGRRFRLRFTKGQKAQPFMETAFKAAKLYARGKVTHFGSELNI